MPDGGRGGGLRATTSNNNGINHNCSGDRGKSYNGPEPGCRHKLCVCAETRNILSIRPECTHTYMRLRDRRVCIPYCLYTTRKACEVCVLPTNVPEKKYVPGIQHSSGAAPSTYTSQKSRRDDICTPKMFLRGLDDFQLKTETWGGGAFERARFVFDNLRWTTQRIQETTTAKVKRQTQKPDIYQKHKTTKTEHKKTGTQNVKTVYSQHHT